MTLMQALEADLATISRPDLHAMRAAIGDYKLSMRQNCKWQNGNPVLSQAATREMHGMNVRIDNINIRDAELQQDEATKVLRKNRK